MIKISSCSDLHVAMMNHLQNIKKKCKDKHAGKITHMTLTQINTKITRLLQ